MFTNRISSLFKPKLLIRTKLIVSAVATIGLALVVVLTVSLQYRNVGQATRTERFTHQVIKDIDDLDSLSYAYLLLKDKRPQAQWQLKHTSLGKLLSEDVVATPDEEALIVRLRSNHQRMKGLFDLIVKNIEESLLDAKNAFSSYDELNEGISAQLLARSEIMLHDASSLTRESVQRMETVRWRSFLLVVASAFILIVSSSLTSFLLAKSIGGPIRKLEYGTQRVASGDLAHRVEVGGDDEISHLAAAFNDMTSRLKTSYASIDDLKRAEEALRKSEEKYRTVADNTYDWEFWIKPAGEFLYCSPSCERVAGHNAEEFIQDANLLRNIVYHEDLPIFDRHRQEEEEEEVTPQEIQFRIIRKDGSICWIGHVCQRVFDEQGKFLGIRGSNRDITDRKLAERAREESEEQMRAFLENSATIAWLKDEEGRHVFLSRNYQERIGVRLKDWKGKTDFEVWPREIAEEFHRNDQAVLAAGRTMEVVERATMPDGTATWWLNSKFVFRDKSGKTYVGGLGVDITERKRAEENLRASEERLRLAQQAARVGAFEWNIQTGHNFWTPELEVLHGLQPGEFPQSQLAWEKLIHPEDRAATLQLTQQSIQTGELSTGEWRVVWPDGSVHWLASRWQVLKDGNGQPLRMIGVNMDITDRKGAEEALHRAHDRASWLAKFPEQNPNPIIRVSEDGTVLYCNSAAATQHGWKCEVGQVLQGELLPLVRQAMAEGRRVQRDVALDGRFYMVSAAPFSEEGYTNLYGRDITDRKLAEEKLKHRTLELQQLTETLEQRVKERTVELADLSAQLVSAQENERKRVSYDLHDNVWQTLLAVRFKVDTLFSSREDWEALGRQSKEVMADIMGAVGKIRSMQGDLWPYVLDDIGIRATIDWYCREFEKDHPGLTIEGHVDLGDHDVPSSAKIVIYRIMQEAMSNVAKHSQANHVSLFLVNKDHSLEITIADNGIGFDPEEVLTKRAPWGGLGILNIKARTELSGGTFEVESIKGKGTTIRASWRLD